MSKTERQAGVYLGYTSRVKRDFSLNIYFHVSRVGERRGMKGGIRKVHVGFTKEGEGRRGDVASDDGKKIPKDVYL